MSISNQDLVKNVPNPQDSEVSQQHGTAFKHKPSRTTQDSGAITSTSRALNAHTCITTQTHLNTQTQFIKQGMIKNSHELDRRKTEAQLESRREGSFWVKFSPSLGLLNQKRWI